MELKGHDYISMLVIFVVGLYFIPIYLDFFGHPFGLIFGLMIMVICIFSVLIARYRIDKKGENKNERSI